MTLSPQLMSLSNVKSWLTAVTGLVYKIGTSALLTVANIFGGKLNTYGLGAGQVSTELTGLRQG